MAKSGSSSAPVELLGKGSGQWLLPASGWRCALELAGNSPVENVCGWCTTSFQGTVFVMEHDDWSGRLKVSEKCGRHMVNQPASDQWLTTFLRYRIMREDDWLSRPWNVSAKGNEWVKERAFRVVIIPAKFHPGKWAYTIVYEACAHQNNVTYAPIPYGNANQAKWGALKHLEELENQLFPVSERTSWTRSEVLKESNQRNG